MNIDNLKDIKDFKNIHFVGIGGVSMSGLALYLKNAGYKVQGSDKNKSNITEKLENLGIKVYYDHKKENINETVDLVVFTSAAAKDNAEIVEAKKRDVLCVTRAEFLGKIMEWFKYSISIAGTHGKTTTTSLVSSVLLEADVDPTITVGGYLPAIDGNFRIGKEDYFVVETCEYCDNFLWFRPYSAIILNVELDHTDYFKTEEQYYNSFNKFAKNVSKDGCVVINTGVKNYISVVKDIEAKVITIGFENADYIAKNMEYTYNGNKFDVYRYGEFLTSITTQVKGEHNVLNTLSTFAICDYLDIDKEIILKGLHTFSGINRRLQYKGNVKGVDIYDDYAHHPTEIKTTLKTLKNMGAEKTYVIFQPHTYSRTKSLLEDFSKSFSECTKVIFVDIFSAREAFDKTVSSKQLARLVKEYSNNSIYAKSFEDAKKIALDFSRDGDIILTMGAGDVYKISDNIVLENVNKG